MEQEKFSFKKRLISFRYAFIGINNLIKTEHNARIHVAAATVVIVSGFLFGLTKTEWCFIIFAIGSVFSAEAFNSAIEALCNYCTLDHHQMIKKCKDIAAGGVLFTAIAAAIIGMIIFIPKIINTINL